MTASCELQVKFELDSNTSARGVRTNENPIVQTKYQPGGLMLNITWKYYGGQRLKASNH
jgi:hypothetical protein